MNKVKDKKSIDDVKLLDLIDLTNLKTLIKRFNDLTGLAVGILDNKGNPLIIVGWQPICIDFHRKNEQTIKNCVESDKYVDNQLQKDEFISYKCKNGLNDVAFPLVIDNMHLATIYFGQFFYDNETIDRDYFIKQAEEYGFDKTKYLEALDKVPIYSQVRVKTILDFYKSIAENIINTAYTNLKLLRNQRQKTSEATLKLAENMERFKSIYQNAVSGIVFADDKGYVIMTNKAFEKIIGFTRKELKGKYIGEFIYSDDFQDEKNLTKQLLVSKKSSFRFEKRYIRKNKSIVWVDISISKIKDDNIHSVYFVAVVNDISKQKETEIKLKEALEYNEKITHTSPVGIVVINKEGKIEFANNHAEKILGLKKEDITKRTYNTSEWKITAFDGGKFPDDNLPFIRVKKELKPVYDVRHTIELPGGAKVYLSINAAPKFNDKNEFDGMVATIENITNWVITEKELEENFRLRNAMIKRAAEGICVCNNCEEFPFVHFTVWNDRMTEMTGYTFEEINEKGWYQSLYPDPEIREKAIQRMVSMREGDDIIAEEWPVTTKDNKEKIISISTSVIKSENDKKHVMALISDVTEKKKYQETIEKHINELQEINLTKDKFFSIISHDLKGPVGSQLQLLEFIVSEIDKKPIDELKNYFVKLLENSKTTYNLIDNLLEWAKVQMGKDKIKPEKFNLKDLVEETTEILKEHAYKKNITIYNLIKPGILAFADKNSIFTVLRNLISNAIKFTNEEGKIKIQTQRFDNSINVCIEDNGIGMTPDQIKEQFNIQTVNSRSGTDKEIGTGIGLLLCKELINKNKGEIWIESEEGRGCKFYFSIPITKSI